VVVNILSQIIEVSVGELDLLERQRRGFVKTRCDSSFADAEVVEIFAESKGPVQTSISIVSPVYKSVLIL
jgi:hypothetical protein